MTRGREVVILFCLISQLVEISWGDEVKHSSKYYERFNLPITGLGGY